MTVKMGNIIEIIDIALQLLVWRYTFNIRMRGAKLFNQVQIGYNILVINTNILKALTVEGRREKNDFRAAFSGYIYGPQQSVFE